MFFVFGVKKNSHFYILASCRSEITCFIYAKEILYSDLSAKGCKRNLSRLLRTTQLNFDRTCFRRCYQIYESVVILYLTLTLCQVVDVKSCKGSTMFNNIFPFFSQGVPREEEVDARYSLDFTEQFVPYVTQRVKYVLF